MSKAFGHKYEFTVWSPAANATVNVPGETNYIEPSFARTVEDISFFSTPEISIAIPAGIRKLVFTNHQIEAEVSYSLENKGVSSQNTTIKLYNLSQNDRNFIRKQGYVTLKAGYKQPVVLRQTNPSDGKEINEISRLPMIFVGQIISVYTEDRQEDQVTTILCSDSKIAANETRISKQYAPKTTYKQIILDLMNEAAKRGISFGGLVESSVLSQESGFTSSTIVQDIQASTTGVIKRPVRIRPTLDLILNNGYVAEGSIISILNEVCEGIGYRQYISLGRLFVEPKKTPNRTAIVSISLDHIKKGVQFESDTSGKSTGSVDNQDGITIDIFLNGELTLDKKLKLINPLFGGYYNITEVSHKLSYDVGQVWDTTIKARRI